MGTIAVFMTLICGAIRRALRLGTLQKAALAVAGVTAVVSPIVIGIYTPAVRAESPQLITPSTGLGRLSLTWHRSNQGPPHARVRFAPRRVLPMRLSFMF